MHYIAFAAAVSTDGWLGLGRLWLRLWRLLLCVSSIGSGNGSSGLWCLSVGLQRICRKRCQQRK